MQSLGLISVNPIVNEFFRTSPRPFSPFDLNRANLALDERQSLLCGFLSSNAKDHRVGAHIPHFTTNLQKLVPERQEGEISKKVQKLFDPSSKC